MLNTQEGQLKHLKNLKQKKRFAKAVKLVGFCSAVVILMSGFFSYASQAKIIFKTNLALNWKPEPEFGGFYAAQLGGSFKRKGLEVEIMPGGSGTPVVQMVAAGKVDFGIVNADELIMARSRGADVVALFAVYQTSPQGIMTRAESRFATVGDLWKSEATLAIQRGLPYVNFLINKFGEPKGKIVPYAGGVASFLADKNYSQQCFVTSEPIEAKKRGVTTRNFLIADVGYNPYTAVVAVRGDLIAKKPALAKSFVEAIRQGWREYLDHPEAANKTMSAMNKAMDLETFNESAELQKPLIESIETKKNGLGKMTEARWTELTQQLHELKVIQSKPDINKMFVNF